MSGLSEYRVQLAGGIPAVIQLSEDDAKAYGNRAVPVKAKAKAPANKSKAPANKGAAADANKGAAADADSGTEASGEDE